MRTATLKPINRSLLKPLDTITVPATTKPFIARKEFVLGQAVGVKTISVLGYRFTELFLGKVEGPAAETKLRIAKLTRASGDGQIVEELGGKAETKLSQIRYLMTLQSDGEQGAHWTAKIFYVRDVNDMLGTVRVAVGASGWSMTAFSVPNLGKWSAGTLVFSRDS